MNEERELRLFADEYGTLYVKDVDGNLKQILVDVGEFGSYGYLAIEEMTKENI